MWHKSRLCYDQRQSPIFLAPKLWNSTQRKTQTTNNAGDQPDIIGLTGKLALGYDVHPNQQERESGVLCGLSYARTSKGWRLEVISGQENNQREGRRHSRERNCQREMMGLFSRETSVYGLCESSLSIISYRSETLDSMEPLSDLDPSGDHVRIYSWHPYHNPKHSTFTSCNHDPRNVIILALLRH